MTSPALPRPFLTLPTLIFLLSPILTHVYSKVDGAMFPDIILDAYSPLDLNPGPAPGPDVLIPAYYILDYPPGPGPAPGPEMYLTIADVLAMEFRDDLGR